jgi:hypothetical protein
MLNNATGLWQVRRQFAYPNEGATAATRYLLTESWSKIAGFSADETQRNYALDALGNWQQQVTEERVADRLRRFLHLLKLEHVGYERDLLGWFQESCGPLLDLGAATGAL